MENAFGIDRVRVVFATSLDRESIVVVSRAFDI